MAIIDSSTVIGGFVTEIITHVTGDPFIAMLSLTIFLLALCIAFGLPMDLAVLLIFPFVLITVLITANMWVILGVLILYISVIIARAFPFL